MPAKWTTISGEHNSNFSSKTTVQKLHCSCGNISIDNVMYDGSLYAEVAAGKYADDTMSFIGEDLPE